MCSRDGVSPQCWRQLLSERVHRRFMGSNSVRPPQQNPRAPHRKCCSSALLGHIQDSRATAPGGGSGARGGGCRSWGVRPFHPQVGPLCVQAPQAACAVSAWSLGWGARGPQGRQLSKYRTWDRAATENKTLREHSAAGSSSRSHPKGSPIPINRNVAW